MPKRPDVPTTQKLPIPAPGDTAALEHAQRWLAHVEAGRIGQPRAAASETTSTRLVFPWDREDAR